MSSGTKTDALKLSRQERANILKVMEKRKGATPPTSGRKSERHHYEPATPPLVELSGAGSFVVVARNLSSGGMAFLHGGPVAAGTRCHVTLYDAEGAAHRIDGSILRCSKIAGRIHDLGVKFDSEVDVAPFLDMPRPAKAPARLAGLAGSSVAIERILAAAGELQKLQAAGWPEEPLRAALEDLARLCETAMQSLQARAS
jgi:hypothetical protein